MKTTSLFFATFVLVCTGIKSQYCNLTGQTPYSSQQPGITNFKLNTINRTSSNVENLTNVVVMTGLSTTLTAGQTYTISLTHSEDAQVFAGARNNLRVWIDYNNNFSFSDAGETVLSVDLQAPATTYSATFTVPLSVTNGTHALRATAKMSIDAGHTFPTPCDVPSDPIGYHGEFEDYVIETIGSNHGQVLVNFALTPSVCTKTAKTVTNSTTGSPTPISYTWTSSPAAGVTFSPSNSATNPAVSFSTSGVYTITCMASNSINTNAISKTVTVNNCNSVGLLSNESIGQIEVIPNPVKDYATITLPSILINSDVEVINYLGKIVFKTQVEQNSNEELKLNFSELENGIYFVKLSTQQGILCKRVVVN